tara:strand:- start:263 stop:436 length:174 start_codon:yes stop_codon:yes gene_type:complete
MSFEDGLLLFLIGMGMTIPGLGLAYYYGSKEKKEEEINPALKDLMSDMPNRKKDLDK